MGRVASPTPMHTELVGHIGDRVAHLIPNHCGARAVHVTPGVVTHYREKHGAQMNVAYAERMLSAVFTDPLQVYQGRKEKTLVFVERYNERFLLIVPVKCGHGHIWQETLYKTETASFKERGWVREGCLYVRGD